MKATGTKVIIELIEEKYEGKIIIPATATKEQPAIGRVLHIGASPEIPVEILPGARVIFDKYAVTEFVIDGQRVAVVEADRILGIISE